MIAETLAPAASATPMESCCLSVKLGRAAYWLAILVMTGPLTPVLCGSARAADAAQAENPLLAAAITPSFRVETELFEGTQTTPQSQHLLLFDSGVIYDLPLGTGTTVTVFDPLRSRVMLLHKIQRVRTSISTDSLIQISAQVRSAAIEQGAENALGFNARVMPAEAPDTYSIEFGDTKYTATTQPALRDGIAAEYAAFTVWACRLNIARHVGSPPFARMTLADFLAAEKALPRQIKLDVRRGLKTRTYRSEHLYVGRLGDVDRKRIRDVGEMIASYTEVPFAAFPVD